MTASATQLKAGSASGTVKLPAGWDVDFNEHLVWHVVRNEQGWARQGTHSTRNRAMQTGGGQKPWRQKGTGRARQGSRRAPQWTGGATVFGPTPRSYGGKVNRKERAAALRSALSMHARRGTVAVIADDAFPEPSTKQAAATRAAWDKADTTKLVVVATVEQENVWKSFRNLEGVKVIPATQLDVAHVMWGRAVAMTESALQIIDGKDA